MTRLSTLFIVALLMFDVLALSCPVREPADVFAAAHRIFLVQILETRFELTEQFGRQVEQDGPIHFVSAGYKVIEEFKGNPESRPRFLQVLHFTGIYADLTPGAFYLIALQPFTEDELEDAPWHEKFAMVTMCEVVTAYLPEDLEVGIDSAPNTTLSKYRLIRDHQQQECWAIRCAVPSFGADEPSIAGLSLLESQDLMAASAG